jgi:hypothetical protein
MLQRIGNSENACRPSVAMHEVSKSTYERNEQEDMKTAIDALYTFRKKLAELHPVVVDVIDNMLQRPRY